MDTAWWKYFGDASKEDLPKNIQAFITDLSAIKLPAEDQKRAKDLIEKIQIDLKDYEQIAFSTAPAPASTTIASSYSIDDILKLNQEMRKNLVEVKSLREDKENKTKQLPQQQEQLNKLQAIYRGEEKRSEGHIIAGLEVIEAKIRLEALKKNLALLDQSIENNTRDLSLLTEEMNTALTRITVTELDILAFSQKVREKNQEWEQSKEELQAAEATRASSGGEEDERAQLLVQNVSAAEIKETLVRIQFITAQIELMLGESVHSPELFNINEARRTINSWESVLAATKKRIVNWKNAADRQIQRTSQSPTLSGVQKDTLSVAQSDLLLLQRLKIEMDDTSFLLDILDKQTSHLMGGGEHWRQQAVAFFTGIFSSMGDWFSQELLAIGNTSITPSGIIRFLIILLLTVWISRFILRGFTAFAKTRPGINKSVVYRVTRLIQYLIITMGTLIALSSLGFDFSNLLLVAGALGVGIGFGLQSIFNNFISGIIILFESQLQVGDYIQLESGMKGEIREINVRSTVITDNDGIDVLIPNSEIISSKVSNWTLKVPYRRIHVHFSAAYGSDKDFIANIVVEAAKKLPHTLKKIGIPDPEVYLLKLGDHGLEFELAVWVNEKNTKRLSSTVSDYLWAIDSVLAENGIVIPSPQMDVHVFQQPPKQN